ncbi:MAG: hypothetical protein ABIR96_09120, partial [Bdellovibrionota bacterium]
MSLVFDGKVSDQASIAAIPAIDGFAIDVAPSGLIKNRMCYVVHVTGDGLNAEGTENHGKDDKNSCPAGVPKIPAFGKIYGPYVYGADAAISVAAGSNRRFDLVGFLNPYSDDPNCSKKIVTSLLKDSSGGVHPLLKYGDYVINDDKAPAGLKLAQKPFGQLGFFYYSNVVTLAPGRQTVSMNRLPWASDRPQEYGCDHGGSSPYPQVTSPMKWYFDEGGPTYCQTVIGDLVGYSHRCIGTSVRQGPMTLQCPPGSDQILVEHATSVTGLLSGSSPSETVACSGGKASYLFAMADRSVASFETGAGATEFFRFTPVVSSSPDPRHSWIAVVNSRPPFKPLQYWVPGSPGYYADSSYLPPQSLLGFASRDDSRSLYFQGSTAPSRIEIVPPENSVPSNLPQNGFLASNATSTPLSPPANSISGTFTLQKYARSTDGFFPIVLAGSPVRPSLFNSSALVFNDGMPTDCGLLSWCDFTNNGLTGDLSASVTSSNGLLVAGFGISSGAPLTVKVGVPGSAASAGILSWGAPLPVTALPLTNDASDLKLHVDADKGLILARYLDGSTLKQAFRACPLGLANCSASTSEQLDYGYPLIDTTIMGTISGERWIVSLTAQGTDFRFHKKPIYAADTTTSFVELNPAVASPGQRIWPSPVDLGFTPSGGFISSAFSPDNGIFGKDLLLGLTGTSTGPTSLIYRSVDGGDTWYLVQSRLA